MDCILLESMFRLNVISSSFLHMYKCNRCICFPSCLNLSFSIYPHFIRLVFPVVNFSDEEMELTHIGRKFRRTFYKWNMSLCTISDVIDLCYGSLSSAINVDVYHIYIYANMYDVCISKTYSIKYYCCADFWKLQKEWEWILHVVSCLKTPCKFTIAFPLPRTPL